MKKVLLAALVTIAPALASAQVQLVSGYNFGQFLFEGSSSTDATTFEDAGWISANWAQGSPPPIESSGDTFTNSPGYSNGTGAVFWNGTAGSSNLVGTLSVAAFDNLAPSINSQTVTGSNMALLGDHSGANMGLFVSDAYSVGFQQNMTGFVDNGALNLTFAAQAAAAPITISWIYNSAVVATTNVGTAWAAYTVDLPAAFYGSISELTATFSGAGRLDNVQFNGAAIPEPSTYAAILGALTMGVVMLRRRKSVVA